MQENAPVGKVGWKGLLINTVRGLGWKGWLGIAALAAVLLAVAAGISHSSRNRHEAPALVSRDSAFFIETRNLKEALGNIAMWPLWFDNRRSGGGEQWNQVHTALSSLITGKQPALGSTQPRIWFANSTRAALAFSPNGQRWLLLFEIPSPGHALAELRQELNLSVTSESDKPDGIVELSSKTGSALFVRAFGPWLMLSSGKEQLAFVDEAVDSPSLSLSQAGVLPEWKSETAFRGESTPAFISSIAGLENPLVKVSSWLSPEARLAFAGRLDKEGVFEMRATNAFRSETAHPDLVWSILKWGFLLILTMCVLIVVTTLALMLGIGGWFKLRTLNAGVKRQSGPAETVPSPAFVADSGGDHSTGRAASAPDAPATTESAEAEPASTAPSEAEAPVTPMASAGTADEPQSDIELDAPLEMFPDVLTEEPSAGIEPEHTDEPEDAAAETEVQSPAPKRQRKPRRAPEAETDDEAEAEAKAKPRRKRTPKKE